MTPLLQFLSDNWTAGIEILLLAVSIYYGYLYFRGTRGAKVFTGLAILFIFLTLVSQILNLTVISGLLRS
jgi:diadenylate cyclase